MTKKNKTRSRANSTGETQKTQDRVPRPGTHDPFFKSLFSIEENAWSLLRAQLPEEIWELLADTPPKIIDASFIAEDLSNCQADLLLEVELTSGDPAFDYILVAHESVLGDIIEETDSRRPRRGRRARDCQGRSKAVVPPA